MPKANRSDVHHDHRRRCTNQDISLTDEGGLQPKLKTHASRVAGFIRDEGLRVIDAAVDALWIVFVDDRRDNGPASEEWLENIVLLARRSDFYPDIVKKPTRIMSGSTRNFDQVARIIP